jgi:hypothetical protein
MISDKRMTASEFVALATGIKGWIDGRPERK